METDCGIVEYSFVRPIIDNTITAWDDGLTIWDNNLEGLSRFTAWDGGTLWERVRDC